MRGSGFVEDFSALEATIPTFKYRQASLDPPAMAFFAMYSALKGPIGPVLACEHPAEN
jgi:hypothetical protein